jgi:TOMM system kinase/cyclase fusion protein
LEPITTGTVFQDRYEVLSKLGEGGFGQVYRARQRVTHHEVAIKVLRALHTTNDTHIARFQREMQLCAQLYHPNIVRLIDSGKAEPDLLYTVFEYVPGRTLTDVLASEGSLPPWEAAHLMLQVLDALACAHNKGVIHRDLKPQNIMITTTGVRRNALVLDFGLGTLPSENQEDLAKITRTREVLGTPTYASPEQLRGDPVTASSDLYSWGLIFLECLTGHRAVDGATLQQVIFKQLGPEPISIPSWLEHHRLGRLLRKVTNKNAELRDITAQIVMRELDACTSEGWPVSEGGARVPTPSQLQVPDTLPSMSEGERRQLTAICCSLRLSEVGDAMDEEDLDRLLRALHVSCAEIARQYDAHVGSVLGEWMLFYFGYPRAQEDDARRAARAALEMSARIEQQATELAAKHKRRLDFRVGIHTGLVISQEGRGGAYGSLPSLMGTTPNHAVRLESRAEPGTILVSEETSKLLRGHFAFESVAASTGASTRPVFRLLHEYKGPASPPSQTGILYGREQELDYLQQRWWQVTAGTGQSILLTGEPGIGKSRLVQELIRHARGTPHSLLESRCIPEGRNSALSPMVDLLERLLGISRDWTPEQTISALEALLSQHGFELKEAMPLFLGLLSVKGGVDRYPPPDVSPQMIKERTLDALVGLCFEMAQQQPLLLLVEDLHWSDPTTLELLSHLVKDVSSASICLVLTARPEFTAPWTTSHHLQVSRLDRKRVEEMVGGLVRNRPVPREVMEQLLNRTDGVPLFVEELTRIVAEALPERGDLLSSRSATPSQIAIPTTLRDSLMARLDRLGPAKELAQLASALGREFSYEVLKAVSLRDEPVLQQELKTLVDADLVHRRRGVRNPTYLFKHALIRDTAYESMLRPARRQVHARIAATMEAHFPELVETRPDLLAMHHAQAGQKREAIGYAQKAGMSALMRSANQEAIAYITEALSWLDVAEDPLERAQLELGLNGVLTPAMMATRGWSDASIGALVERSQQLIDVLGDRPQTVPTLWGLSLFHLTRGNQLRARPLAERLVSMAKQAGNTELEIMSLNMLGNSAFTEGKLSEALGYFERTLAMYEPSKHHALASLYGQDARSWGEGFVSWAKWLMGYPDQAEALSQRSLAWAYEMKHTSSIGLAYLYRLAVLQWRGDRDKLIAEASTGEEFLMRHGLPMHAAFCAIFRNWARREIEPVRQALAAHQGAGLELGKSNYKLMLADLELEAGRPDVALEIADELITWGRANAELYVMADLLRMKGLCLRARGEQAAAETVLREAIATAQSQGAKMLELKAVTALGELLRERGRLSEAREMLAPLAKGITEGLGTPELVRAKGLLGQLTA